jgi:hypothetical protein
MIRSFTFHGYILNCQIAVYFGALSLIKCFVHILNAFTGFIDTSYEVIAQVEYHHG